MSAVSAIPYLDPVGRSAAGAARRDAARARDSARAADARAVAPHRSGGVVLAESGLRQDRRWCADWRARRSTGASRRSRITRSRSSTSPQILTAVVLGKIGTAAVTDTLVQVSRLPKTVLVVDDLHLLSGQPGATPLSQRHDRLLSPAARDGRAARIFTTIPKEYETKLASDPLYSRRASLLYLEELAGDHAAPGRQGAGAHARRASRRQRRRRGDRRGGARRPGITRFPIGRPARRCACSTTPAPTRSRAATRRSIRRRSKRPRAPTSKRRWCGIGRGCAGSRRRCRSACSVSPRRCRRWRGACA